MFKKVSIPILLLVSALLVSSCAAGVTAVDDNSHSDIRKLSINGTGRVKLTPDIAHFSVGVYTEDKDAEAAVESNSESAKKLIDALVDSGIKEKDIQTSNFSIYPRQDRDRDGNIIEIVYVVNNTVNVTIRDLDSVGKTLNDAIKAGANNVHGIRFDIEDRAAAEELAIQAAVENASSRAEILASASNITLDKVFSIESYIGGGGTPIYRMDMMTESVGASYDVPISTGEIEIVVDVSIVFSLK